MFILFVDFLIRAIMMLVLVSSLLSWFQPDPRNPLVKLVQGIVGPILHPIQVLLPSMGGIDFSPLVALVLLGLLRSLILHSPAF